MIHFAKMIAILRLMDVICRGAEVAALVGLRREPAWMPASCVSVADTPMPNDCRINRARRQAAKGCALLAAQMPAVASMRHLRLHLTANFYLIEAVKVIDVDALSYAALHGAVVRTANEEMIHRAFQLSGDFQ
jgi:hypothetical protein